MIIGIPTEIKSQENRVSIVPAMAHDLVMAGHEVIIQAGAGAAAGFDDPAYGQAGARIVADAPAVYGEADMVLKVKEPLPVEYPLIRPGQMLFTYFHFAADQALTDAMLASGAHCFAYETLTVAGQRPLLTPMSEIAGRMAVQSGAFYLEAHNRGRGILLGGVPGVAPAEVLILGGGVVGTEAARMAAGLGAQVHILDIDLARLRYLDAMLPANVITVASSPYAIRDYLPHADLVIGAVLVSGARAPTLIRREDLQLLKNDGPVIIDVAVDQGGCIETCAPTTHADPTFIQAGVLHYCVANMPGAVPRTATFALTNATKPYVLQLAAEGVATAASDPVLSSAANILAGEITHQGIAEAFGRPWRAPTELFHS